MEHWLKYFMQMLYVTFKQLVTLNSIDAPQINWNLNHKHQAFS